MITQISSQEVLTIQEQIDRDRQQNRFEAED
jgi:hypothetical protein